MKKNALYLLLVFCSAFFYTCAFAQAYMSVDSARKLVISASTSDERFAALRALDRFYYTTGKFDSSGMVEKDKKIRLAAAKKSDRAIGER